MDKSAKVKSFHPELSLYSQKCTRIQKYQNLDNTYNFKTISDSKMPQS